MLMWQASSSCSRIAIDFLPQCPLQDLHDRVPAAKVTSSALSHMCKAWPQLGDVLSQGTAESVYEL